MPSSRKYNISAAGFTLVELMVSIAIVLIVAGIILVRYQSFNSSVILKNLAYEVAISVREAQVLSVSVLGDSGDFSGVYGLYFNFDTNPNSYILFRDLDGDEVYDTNETFETFRINTQFQLDSDYEYVSSGSTQTGSGGEVTMTFERPDFDARFDIDNDGIDTNISALTIIVEPLDQSASRRITITNTGQISVP